jgi:hypothetical protein
MPFGRIIQESGRFRGGSWAQWPVGSKAAREAQKRAVLGAGPPFTPPREGCWVLGAVRPQKAWAGSRDQPSGWPGNWKKPRGGFRGRGLPAGLGGEAARTTVEIRAPSARLSTPTRIWSNRHASPVRQGIKRAGSTKGAPTLLAHLGYAPFQVHGWFRLPGLYPKFIPS